MKNFLRNTLAIVFGLVLGGGINMLLITFGPSIIPPPAGVDVTDVESISASIHLFEPKHFAVPFLAHALGTLVGAATAFLMAVSNRTVFAYTIGVVFLIGGIAAAFMIPAPNWFMVLDIVVAYLPMAWLGIALGRCLEGYFSNKEK